jgi:uncharacterized membrane protein YdjX (TVP38/TMEM64 family)
MTATSDPRQPPSAPAAPDRTWPRELLRLGLGTVAFVAAAVLLREHFDQLEAWLTGLGGWAPLAFVMVHAVAVPCFIPVSLLGFLAGATFGFWVGTAVLVAGGLISAAIMFALARGLFPSRIRAYMAKRPRLARFVALAEQDAMRLMVLLRLSPLNFALVSYLLGASRVRFWPYMLASGLVLPSAALQAYVGRTARVMGRRVLAGEQANPWQNVAAVVAIMAAVILAVMLGRLARRSLEAEVPAGGDGGAA